MTNEEKVEEIALKYARNYLVSRNDSHKQNIFFEESSIIECEKAALEMAEWKDEQFEEEKKELRGLVDMLQIDDHNQTIIENLKGLLS